MKNLVYVLLISVCMIFMPACTINATDLPENQNDADISRAQEALITFLKDLHNENYKEAADLYGGTYDELINYNSSIDPTDDTALLKNACTINGFQCLEIKSIRLDKATSSGEFDFQAEFYNADGILFVRGPCCGGDETDSPLQSSFDFKVIKDGAGKFQVMDLPPYVP
jgi:hypothetical protein